MAIIRHTAYRWQRLIDLLHTRPYTVAELAEALKVSQKTVRSYLSAVAKTVDVQAEGPHGATRYWIESNTRDRAC